MAGRLPNGAPDEAGVADAVFAQLMKEKREEIARLRSTSGRLDKLAEMSLENGSSALVRHSSAFIASPPCSTRRISGRASRGALFFLLGVRQNQRLGWDRWAREHALAASRRLSVALRTRVHVLPGSRLRTLACSHWG